MGRNAEPARRFGALAGDGRRGSAPWNGTRVTGQQFAKDRPAISAQRRNEIVDALRRGTVPRRSLDAFAVGLEPFETVVGQELASVAAGGAKFKAVRGEYGSGKTFFVRWLQERAKREGFAAAEVQISETETPLHRLETVYRRLTERLSTADTQQGALRAVLDNWFYVLEEDVLAEGGVVEDDAGALLARTTDLMERRLAAVARHAPAFAAALARLAAGRGGERARHRGGAPGLDRRAAQRRRRGQAVRRRQGRPRSLRRAQLPPGPARHPARLRLCGAGGGARRGRDAPAGAQRRAREEPERPAAGARRDRLRTFPGPVPGDHRDPRVLRGTARGAAPAAARPAARRGLLPARTGSTTRGRRRCDCRTSTSRVSRRSGAKSAISTPRAPPPRSAFWSGRTTRTSAASPAPSQAAWGARVGIAPRVFLKKLVQDVLDRIDLHPDFDPRRDYALTLTDGELTDVERNARAVTNPDDVELEP